jgi:hypothetical protein
MKCVCVRERSFEYMYFSLDIVSARSASLLHYTRYFVQRRVTPKPCGVSRSHFMGNEGERGRTGHKEHTVALWHQGPMVAVEEILSARQADKGIG